MKVFDAARWVDADGKTLEQRRADVRRLWRVYRRHLLARGVSAEEFRTERDRWRTLETSRAALWAPVRRGYSEDLPCS